MPLALASVGAFGFAVQVVLLRELMSTFSGNELSAGLVVGIWIFCESLGALAGTRLRSGFGLAAVASVAASLAAVPAAVLSPRWFGLLPAETAGIPALVAITLTVVLLPALLHGLLFTLGASALARAGDHGTVPARAYVWEGLGAVAAALLVSFLLLPRLSSLGLLALFGLPVSLAGLAAGKKTGLFAPAAGVLSAALCLVLLSGQARRVEAWACSRLWAGQQVARIADSRHGRLAVLQREGQTVVFASGSPVYALPEPDPARFEELVHIPLLCHPHPRRALILGQGLGACLREALRHPLDRVTVVELDPDLARLITEAGGGQLSAALDDPRTRLHVADPRRWLAGTADTFDCIIVTDPAPMSLAANRLFSEEFFALCRRRLGPDGLLAVPAPGLVSRLTADASASLATRARTLRRVFPEVRPLLADFPLVLASASRLTTDPDTIAARFAARGPATVVLDSSYLAGLLDPFRQQQLARWLADTAAAPVNTDLCPVELRLSMTRAGQVAASFFAGLYRRLARLSPFVAALAGLLLLAVALLGARRGSGFPVTLSILTSGFAAAALSTLLLYGYAVRFGSAYSGAAALIGAFMAGSVAGAALGRHARRGLFIAAEAVLLALPAALIPLVRSGPGLLFLLAAGLAGTAVGTQFAVAGRAGTRQDPARTAGRLLALDLLGGCAGGVLTALFLAPVWGLALAALTVAGVKLASLAGLLAERGRPVPAPASPESQPGASG